MPCSAPEASAEDVLQQAFILRDLLGIRRVVVHRIQFAVSASDEGGSSQRGPYCANPKKSTGAGDRFNAGFCLGLARQFGAGESLALACAVSGFFVRNARSASHQELIGFLRQWADGSLDAPD